MKVFISSIISGFAEQREAARRAVTALRHQAVMAEDFGAQPNSPQVACLQELRSSDIVVLILGENYGFVPPGSALSATHQEYREARGRKPVLAFVQQGITPGPEQAAFIEEVQGWEGGLFREGFISSEDLQDGVTRALHDVTLASAVGPVDEQDLIARAVELIPGGNRNQLTSPYVDLALAGGPTQRILRPAELEMPSLAEHLQQSAMFGDHRLFDRAKGSESAIINDDLVVQQDRGATIRLTEDGAIAFRLPVHEPAQGERYGSGSGMMVLVQEDVQQRLTAGLGFASALIERLYPTQRLTHFAVAARITGAEYRAWRTRAEHDASPNSVQIGLPGDRDRAPVTVAIRRAALRLDRSNLVEDILVPLRRQFSAG